MELNRGSYLQDSIVQDGRAVRVELTYRFSLGR